MYTVFVFLGTGYTLLTLLQESCKYGVFQAKGYPPAWFPIQLWEAGVESLGLPCTWLRLVAGAVKFYLHNQLATWCVASRFQGQCCFAPPYLPQTGFPPGEGGPRGSSCLMVPCQSLLWCSGPGSRQRHVFTVNTEDDLYKQVSLYLE